MSGSLLGQRRAVAQRPVPARHTAWTGWWEAALVSPRRPRPATRAQLLGVGAVRPRLHPSWGIAVLLESGRHRRTRRTHLRPLASAVRHPAAGPAGSCDPPPPWTSVAPP